MGQHPACPVGAARWAPLTTDGTFGPEAGPQHMQGDFAAVPCRSNIMDGKTGKALVRANWATGRSAFARLNAIPTKLNGVRGFRRVGGREPRKALPWPSPAMPRGGPFGPPLGLPPPDHAARVFGRAFQALSAVIALRAPSSVRKRMEWTLWYFNSHPPSAASSHSRCSCSSRHISRISSSCA